MVRENLGLKFIALFLALGAWVYVHSESDMLLETTVPLDLSGIPAEFERVGEAPEPINLRLRGPEFTLSNLERSDVKLSTGLGSMGMHSGENEIELVADMVQVPLGVTVEEIAPMRVTITLEPRANREMPVTPSIVGKPAEGYEVAGITMVPNRMTVQGPASAVAAIESLETAPIRIENDSKERRAQVRVSPTGPSSAQVRLVGATTSTDVTVVIRRIQSERSFTNVALRVIGLPDDAPQPQLEPATASVLVRGPEERLDRINAADLQVTLDLTGQTGQNMDFTTEDLTVRPADPTVLNLEGLELVVTAPATVRVTMANDNAS